MVLADIRQDGGYLTRWCVRNKMAYNKQNCLQVTRWYIINKMAEFNRVGGEKKSLRIFYIRHWTCRHHARSVLWSALLLNDL